ncbi:MAG TPA: ATP-binding protein, partial [Acidimicrobiales bacterium]|nr:ATP-binding protein [Acidimicrobiales bacterium]
MELAGYRIVQEALTNAARHAPGAKVSVEVVYGSSHITLRIVNGPALAPAWQISGSGHGIEGMRERARTCEGHLHAGPTPDGGFCVFA